MDLSPDQFVRLELVKKVMELRGFETYRDKSENFVNDIIEPCAQYILGTTAKKRAPKKKTLASEN